VKGPRNKTCSVVIPAHNEAAHIEAVLSSLLESAAADEFEVIVVCNGCTDATADLARRSECVRVEEIATASKIAALNHGDSVASTFPRLYLDGDTLLSTDAARAVATRLCSVAGPAAAGVRGSHDFRRSSLFARLYVSFRDRLPVFSKGIIGAGIYAMNEAGRQRFDRWPDIIGDDQFVLRLFSSEERHLVTEHRSIIEAPGSVREIIRRGVRVHRGNRELSKDAASEAATVLDAPSSGWRIAARACLSRPARWPELLTWVALQIAIRARSWAPAGGDWERSRRDRD